jgi:hypothetical protein
MRTALRTKGYQRQVSISDSLPAPVGGWNTRDSIAAMPPEDAVKLDNFFPTTVDVEIRGGQADYATTITGTVETLATYTGLDGVEQFFAVTDTDCYDISAAGVASAETWTDQDDGKYQWLNMGDGTNEWLLMFNGIDAPKYYDGSSWVEVTGATSPALIGPTVNSLITACTYHGRLYLVEKSNLSFWYLPAGVVGGTAVEFDLSPFASLGGYIEWMATWTFDAGDGLDDMIVFMTSEGQAIIYTGTDPASSSLWSRVGTYFLGKPLGRRSYVQYGGDILAITQDGIFPMSEGIRKATINDRVAVSDKIQPTFTKQAKAFGANFGWQAQPYPLKNAMIFNIPLNVTTGQVQYVMNTITQAWSQFKSWPAQCWGIYNDELYYGLSGAVQKAWSGASDDGSNIVAEGQTAWNNFGASTQSKDMKMFRPMIQTNGTVSYLTDIDVDFRDTPISGVATFTPGVGGVWGTGLWGTATWTGSLDTILRWTSPDVYTGYYFSGKLKVETKTTDVHWLANDYVYETGGIIS